MLKKRKEPKGKSIALTLMRDPVANMVQIAQKYEAMADRVDRREVIPSTLWWRSSSAMALTPLGN